MKHVVNIFKTNNGYTAECNELKITALGKDIVEVKRNFV